MGVLNRPFVMHRFEECGHEGMVQVAVSGRGNPVLKKLPKKCPSCVRKEKRRREEKEAIRNGLTNLRGIHRGKIVFGPPLKMK